MNARNLLIGTVALAVVTAVAVIAAVVGGRDTVAGLPRAGEALSNTSPSTSSSKVANAADLDPCQLLSAKDQVGMGLTEPPEKDTALSNACVYVMGRTVISMKVRLNQGITQVQDVGGQIHELTVNGRAAKKVTGQPAGGCLVAVGIAASSRVDIQVAGDDDAEDCVTAEKAAKFVEPKLPKG